MRVFSPLTIGLLTAGLLMPALVLPAQESSPQPDALKKDALEVHKGMPPRATPGDYQGHVQVGKFTIAAEFMGHAVPTPDQTVDSEDYVVVEAGLFGPPGARLTLARTDFSLRINGKKTAVPNAPLELVYHSLKDPEWQPPHTDDDDSKSKGSGLTTGGGGGGADKLPPLPPKMPFELRRAMNLHVEHAAMEEGERALPQAGLLFFSYRGKEQGIHSVELIYSGAAGNATLDLMP
ncbi:MAG TPA: hypothetical protein VME17_23020 [Bryobacteraceae bacterium]|nr:hypothetical protein [Bryobacteraceae bacterium]